ncbi:hypothetical protein [Pontibacter sp. SGAir0037]|uniref:hypothetical protein n=1 Tax=Pontibacter sp. SGAir0037 TaxID=2571030 RepID=UPI0010CCFCC3|nr:hypothetical protein [Pontibacter sp. SGAir0037]QCR23977.1 hypothetical protein C1N53_17550 [Pontibacter sp. SGAir0037]
MVKKFLHAAIFLLVLLPFSSCVKDVYKRPITINKFEFQNQAGAAYEAQFQKINNWQLLKLDSIQKVNKTVFLDAKAGKRQNKLNYTLAASLEKLDSDDKKGLRYQLYLKPNNGIGKMKSGIYENMYVELDLYSPEKKFFEHGFFFYRDSVLVGASSHLLPVQELKEPANADSTSSLSFAIDHISFSKGFTKRQRKCIVRLLNNSFVAKQHHNVVDYYKKGKSFNFYPNFLPKATYTKAIHTFSYEVVDSPDTNQILVRLHYSGELPSWFSREISFNRKNFKEGHYYEAAHEIQGKVQASISALSSSISLR